MHVSPLPSRSGFTSMAAARDSLAPPAGIAGQTGGGQASPRSLTLSLPRCVERERDLPSVEHVPDAARSLARVGEWLLIPA